MDAKKAANAQLLEHLKNPKAKLSYQGSSNNAAASTEGGSQPSTESILGNEAPADKNKK
jgi:hypothetical protein